MSFLGFVHPALLWGLLAAGVPILIHLLNRRRYRRLAWAASAFLLAAYRRTRRRMRMENFLLLLARTAAVALLALAIARPHAGVEGPVAALAESRRDEVVVLDASYSMGYRGQAGSTPWERAIEAAREILDRARPERGDRAALLLAKTRPEEIRASGREELRRELARLAEEGPPQEGSDFRATLGLVDRVLEGFGAGGSSTVTFVTDLQRKAFSPPETPATRPVHAAAGPESAPASGGSEEISSLLRSIAGRGARLRVRPVGPSEAVPPNLGVTSLRPDPEDAGFFAGAPLTLQATVRNHGREARTGVLAHLLVDGIKKGAARIDVPAGAEVPVSFPAEVFTEPGGHGVEVVLEADGLQPDDRRGYGLLVRPPIRVLLVESEMTEDPELWETGPLMTALRPPEDGESGDSPPFVPTVVDRSRFNADQENLADYDVVVLPNLESLSDRIVERLEPWVAGGGALLLWLGERVEPSYYHARLRRPDGGGLLPAKIGELRSTSGREGPPFRLVLRDPRYPAFRFFTDPRYALLLSDTSVFRFFQVEPDEGAVVPAVYTDPSGSPALVEKRVGRGRVALIPTRARPEWWPLVEQWWVVPLLFDLLRHLTAPEVGELERAIGEPLRLVCERAPLRAWVTDALGRRSPIPGSARPAGPDRWSIPEVGETRRAGIYAIEVEVPGRLGTTETRTTRFAVNVDPEEGDLRQIEAAEAALSPFFPGTTVELAGAEEERDDKEEEGRGEFWRACAAACLGFLLVEAGMAAFFGRRRA